MVTKNKILNIDIFKQEKALKQSEKRKVKKEQGLSNGHCTKGCLKPQLKNSIYCDFHYVRGVLGKAIKPCTMRQTKILLDRFYANNKCPYTGVILELSVNTNLDHKYPKSRFPELKNDIDNLEWVSKKVNRSKHNLTKKEFLDMCLYISNKFS